MATFTKNVLARIKPGTWITLQWDDASNQSVLLLEKINRSERGDISISYFDPDSGKIERSFATHKQIIGIGRTIETPVAYDETRPETFPYWLED